MRIVSDRFKDIQNELIRPQAELYFEVGSDVLNALNAAEIYGVSLDLDDTVAPIVPPNACINEKYYAIVGDSKGVDDPNRICAPDDPTVLPDIAVPYGVTPYTAANTEALIGNGTNFYQNFIGFPVPATLSFKGGLIPEQIRVEIYDFDLETWSTEKTIVNTEMSEEIVFEPDDYETAGKYRRFYALNSEESGRYQFNFLRIDYGSGYGGVDGHPPVVYKNNYISSINIDTETDLTSQTLPSYEMKVEVLDVDEIYTPNSDYWTNQFEEGSICYFKLGFDIDGFIEYIPFFLGKLTKAPTYEHGKITFDVAINLRGGGTSQDDFNSTDRIYSLPYLSTGNTGDGVVSDTFFNIIELARAFNTYDVFHGQTDIDESLCNCFAELECDNTRQLIANALGCYITCGFNTIDLHNTNDIQYREFQDYLTRYEQIQNTLESKQKVGKIDITRNWNTLSSDYADIQATEQVRIEANETNWCEFKVPFYAIGKISVVNYNKTNSQAAVSIDFVSGSELDEYTSSDGYIRITLWFKSNKVTNIRPVVRFFRVDNEQLHEITEIEDATGETYENSNELITYPHVAGKAKRVALLVSEMPNKYEVDVMQNFLYELGDIIRLETQKDIFKTCVITGLNFTLPGSSGHVSCRKIFSMLDCTSAVFNPKGVVFNSSGTLGAETTTVLTTDENCIVAGIMRNVVGGSQFPFYIGQNLLYILGAVTVHRTFGAYDFDTNVTHYFTDLNGHEWGYFMIECDPDEPITTTVPIVELPEYDETETGDVDAFALTNLIRTIYSEQGMTAPVDYTCTTHEVIPPTP